MLYDNKSTDDDDDDEDTTEFDNYDAKSVCIHLYSKIKNKTKTNKKIRTYPSKKMFNHLEVEHRM